MKKTVKSIRKIPWLMTMNASSDNPVGLIDNAALLIESGRIHWIGKDRDCPTSRGAGIDLDGTGLVAMPGLIDCHTHLVFAGDRVDDFHERARGASYAQIMARGGGIQHTVAQTRQASQADLLERAYEPLKAMLARGVTSVEVKSGYGLNLDDEVKMLEVVADLGEMQPVQLFATFLGAHAVPAEFKDRSGDYIDYLLKTVLPQIAQRKLASAVDVFVEQGAFGVQEAKKILVKALELGLRVKVHAEQLSASGGAKLAAEMGALSASHLEHATQGDFRALAAAHVVAEILPLSEIFLGLSQVAELRPMIDIGIKLAIATDFNPGSSMCDDLQLAMRIAVTQRKLHVEEALLGITHHAACALGEQTQIGKLVKGMRADICLFEGRSPWSLAYDWTRNPMRQIVKAGVLVHQS